MTAMNKRIVCYGDSNTWGWTPITMQRYDENIRWPSRTRTILGADYEIVEEGLPGRTTVFADPLRAYCNGVHYLPACLLSHAPLDLLILMLGTNDFQMHFPSSAKVSAQGIQCIIEEARKLPLTLHDKKLPVLIIAPVAITDDRLGYKPNDTIGKEQIEASKELAGQLVFVAQEMECSYLNANDYIKASSRDGLHLDPESHIKLADVIALKVKEIIG